MSKNRKSDTVPGAFSWCELMTTEVDAAKVFYTKLFGWDTEDMSMPGMTYTMVKAGGKGIGGIMSIPKEAQGTPPMWGAYVTVDDVDLTARTAEQLGARLLVPPRDIPNVGRLGLSFDRSRREAIVCSRTDFGFPRQEVTAC